MAKKLKLVLSMLSIIIFAGCISGSSSGSGSGSFMGSTGNFPSAHVPSRRDVPGGTDPGLVVIAFNDLGMHCMNQDFSQFMILPPFNTVHAEVIDTSTFPKPTLVISGVELSYSIVDNTTSAGKTNFWQYVNAILHISLPVNIGLSGNGLTGIMTPETGGDWIVTGIPVTPLNDQMVFDPFNLGEITVTKNGVTLASTQTVVPVSWEIRCDMCHAAPGQPVMEAPDQLTSHDKLHGTNLINSQPVFCGSCHQQAPLGSLAPGVPGVESLSRAMHKAHANRMGDITDMVACFACHPGPITQCLRDVHHIAGMTCLDCHISMAAVADPARQPWITEPRCDDCHKVRGHIYEQPGTLYRNSVGHGNLRCPTCHQSPHAVAPSSNPKDNLQAIALQGNAGTLNKCTLCHPQGAPGLFAHAPPSP